MGECQVRPGQTRKRTEELGNLPKTGILPPLRLVNSLRCHRPHKARTECQDCTIEYAILFTPKMPDFESFANPRSKATYRASCHCGKGRFAVTMPSSDTVRVISCNCSICEINAYLNVYPFRQDVVFESPYEELGSYRFAGHTRVHKFCRACGTSLLIDFDKADEEPLRKHVAVNV
jgi:hypothetical protein